MNIGEKVAYLKGLAEGLELDTTSKNGKLIAGILDVLEMMSESLGDLEEQTESISGYIEDLDEDLGEVEEKVFKCESFMPEHGHKHYHTFHDLPKHHEHECDCGCECDECENDADDVVEFKCPMCGDKILVEVDMILDNDVIDCPNCGKPIRIVQKNSNDSCGGGCCCGECDDKDDVEDENDSDSDIIDVSDTSEEDGE